MAYVLGAAKKIEVGGITFHVRTPADAFEEWMRASRALMAEVATAGDSVDADLMAALEAKGTDLRDAALGFVVGWEGVTDEAGEPAPFSREALGEVDIGIVRDLYGLLTNLGEQVQREITSGN